MSALKIDELVDALGDYNREHRDVLISEALLDEDFQNNYEVMDDVTDEVPLPSLAITDLIKPGNPTAFQPTSNALQFGARILKVRPIKVDLLLVPQIMEKTWLGKMKKSSDHGAIPFEQFIMQYISSKIRENVRLQGIYKGVYNAAGTTPIDTMTGWLKLIADDIADVANGQISPVVTGAVTATNIIDSAEAVYDGLGEAYKNVPTEMKVAPSLFDWYGRRYRSLFNGSPIYTGIKRDRVQLDGTLCELVRDPGLAGSQRMICTPKENLVFGVDSLSDYNLDIQKENRTIKILIDFKAGVEFKEVHPRALSVNDQA
ncbi:hypothetical protein D770_20265 [Flammeovirgaceae bacterium 311]|nr:hypothetical protein D770_20265 [Flammeovirgaceae bacterium 311]